MRETFYFLTHKEKQWQTIQENEDTVHYPSKNTPDKYIKNGCALLIILALNIMQGFIQEGNYRHKKTARRRFLLDAYLAPGMLKRLLKRSTRPPVATSRCLPV
jgi:hypothetical protein